MKAPGWRRGAVFQDAADAAQRRAAKNVMADARFTEREALALTARARNRRRRRRWRTDPWLLRPSSSPIRARASPSHERRRPRRCSSSRRTAASRGPGASWTRRRGGCASAPRCAACAPAPRRSAASAAPRRWRTCPRDPGAATAHGLRCLPAGGHHIPLTDPGCGGAARRVGERRDEVCGALGA